MSAIDQGNDIQDPKMPLTEHLRELRKRLVIIFATVGVAFLVAWGFREYIILAVKWPLLRSFPEMQLQFDTLTDPFFSHLKASFFAAFFLTFPLTLGQIWLFIGPGLYNREKGVVWPFLLLSFPLFVGGGLFCYMVVFPIAVEFLISFDPTLAPSLRIGDYLSFTLRLTFVFGLVFEMPLISLLLTRMGMLTPEFLSTNRRYAIVIVFIAAAVLTPPDVFTQVLLAGPLVVLYEISIIVSRVARRKKPPEEDKG